MEICKYDFKDLRLMLQCLYTVASFTFVCVKCRGLVETRIFVDIWLRGFDTSSLCALFVGLIKLSKTTKISIKPIKWINSFALYYLQMYCIYNSVLYLHFRIVFTCIVFTFPYCIYISVLYLHFRIVFTLVNMLY
jgi:hypothetical protein